MRLVNPNVINIERNYRFFTIVTDCAEFKDDYTEGVVEKTGCFGCENLSDGDYGVNCTLDGHIVKFAYIRKDDENNIMGNCKVFSSNNTYRLGEYLQKGCKGCARRYRGSGRDKCKNKFNVSEEVYRIG